MRVRDAFCLIATLAACDDGATATAGAGGATSGPAPDLQSDWIVLGVGDPVLGGPPPGSFQDALDGWMYIFDAESPDDANAEYLCQHDAPQMADKLAEGHWSDELVCAPAPDDPPTTDVPHTGDPGTNLPPPGYKSWYGGSGGCGIWSSLMCDRILGLVDPDAPITQAEWEQTAAELGASAENGGSLVTDVQWRYQALGYCTTRFNMAGGPNDYGRVRFYKDQLCDVKLAMWRRDENGQLSKGHVEVVVDAASDHATTNSFGTIGTIEGGSLPRFPFRFRRGDLDAVDDRGDLAYEPDATTLHAVVVCPCGVFESLGVKVLGGG